MVRYIVIAAIWLGIGVGMMAREAVGAPRPQYKCVQYEWIMTAGVLYAICTKWVRV
jgi:hypothetical protein